MENKEINDIVDAMFNKIKDEDKTEEKFVEIHKGLDKLETDFQKSALKIEGVKEHWLVKSLKSQEFKDTIQTKGYNWEIKAGTILDPTSFGQAGVAPVVLPMREAGVGKDPVRPLHVSELIQWGTTTSNTVDWIEVSGKTNAAAMRAEGSAMAQGDLQYIEYSQKVKSLSEYMIVTNESLKDASFLASEIQTELFSDLQLLLDDQLLNGDNTGNNLNGINNIASAFTAGEPFATGITEANNADVLRVAINNIHVAGNGRWMPNYILMNPTDVAILDLLKISDGRYIDVPFYSAEGASVKRIPLIENTGIDIDDFLVGDFTRAKAFVRDPLAVRVFDQHASTAISNLSTITGNMRVVQRIKNVDYGAFIKGTFTAAKILLED